MYRQLGYSSIYQYPSEELGFSATRTGDFKRLAEKLEVLPAVSAKVKSGELGYTKAREIVKVADPGNETDWLAVAGRQTRRELEATVRHAKIAAKRKSHPGQTELMPSPDSPPVIVPVRVGFDMSPAQLARCDAQVHESGKRNRSTIPPRIRREIMARDRHQCRRKGCNHNLFLDIHHIVPRSRGGSNDPANLVTLCSACHHLWHEKGGDLTGLLSDRLMPKEMPQCSKPPANI